MVVTADSVLALAKSIRSLSEGQMQRIQDVAMFMNEEDLKKLEEMLKKIKASEEKDMEKKVVVAQKVKAKFEEYKADKARDAREKQEAISQENDAQVADQLLSNM